MPSFIFRYILLKLFHIFYFDHILPLPPHFFQILPISLSTQLHFLSFKRTRKQQKSKHINQKENQEQEDIKTKQKTHKKLETVLC